MSDQLPLDLALELREEYGLATIPIVAGTKRPSVGWKQFQHVGPSAAELTSLFDRKGLTVGVLCGEPSDRLLVLDCDNPDSLDRAVSDLRKPATPIIQTARGGHIYLRTPVPVRGAKVEGIEFRAQGQYVLAPGAVHPSGIRYAWISRTDRIHELPDLDVLPWLHLQPAPRCPDGLPRLAWQILTGERLAGPHERSETEATAVSSLIEAGYAFEGVLGVFSQLAHPRSKFRELERDDPANAIRWLQLTYDRVQQYLEAHESETRRLARSLSQIARSGSWTGRSGSIDRAVFLAHLKIMERCAKPEYGASARELGELAGISFQAAINANHRLQKRGLLELKKSATASFPHVWRPASDVARFIGGHSLDTNCEGVSIYETAAHDVFRRSGLGKSAAQIWTLLQQGKALTPREIANATGRGRATVWRALKAMQQLGMISPSGIVNKVISWAAVPGVDLDTVARKLRTAGLGSRQRIRHINERAAHRRALQRTEGNSGT